ncbi:MAG: redoxin domain-containing protein [Planctomycetia bacterium]|nr:redoxin domain-containing protein [Planctomycetia bacterium]
MHKAIPLVILSAVSWALTAHAAPPSPVGKKIDSFTARDFRGKEVSLADFREQIIVVVAFMGTECPLAKLYGPRLAELAAEFGSRGVAFVGVNSNRQDSMTEIAHYARTHKIDFPLLRDSGNVIADQFGAIRTPEVFVLDGDRTIRYWGRVDDQFGFQGKGIAYQRNEPHRRDLAEAIEDLLAGRNVGTPVTVAQGCHIGRVKESTAEAEVTYSKHIAKVLNDNCAACHRPGQIGPFPLTSYDEAAGWAGMIREVVEEQRMPPWHADPKYGHFRNDARLTDGEKALLYEWVAAGAPEGDPADLPAPPQFTEGWMIPEPEQVIYMRDEPFEVPAQGTVEYQKFLVDPGWTEDKWVKAIECKPGNPAVVHHIIVYLVPPGVTPTGAAGRVQSNWLGAYAPGLRPVVLDEGLARYVQKGSKFLFEMHYTANGSRQLDRSYAGFVFADPAKVKKEVAVQNAGNFTFKIPPGDPNFPVEADFVFRQNSLLLSVSPHLHVRGKDFLYELIYPDGKKETVLWVPRYDFGWQTTYELAEPKQVPRGSKLHCVAHFDNSPDNLANPNPSAEVAWGEQTWEEMMFGWFEMALADQDLTKPASESALRVKDFLERVAEGNVNLDDQIQHLARHAFESDRQFSLLCYQLFDLVPQLDRVCITAVHDDHLRLRMIAERPGLKSAFRSPSTVVKAAGQALAEYALADQVTVNDDLTAVHGSIMTKIGARDIRSSMHVPVDIGGQPATVNFWSAELGAFPPPAVELLTDVARAVAQGPSKADAGAATAPD